MGFDMNSSFGFGSSGGGGGGSVTDASDGLSLFGTDVVLGQAVGAVGDPALLTSDREVPTGGFAVILTNDIFETQLKANLIVTAVSDFSEFVSFSVSPVPTMGLFSTTNASHLLFTSSSITIEGDAAVQVPTLTIIDNNFGQTLAITSTQDGYSRFDTGSQFSLYLSQGVVTISDGSIINTTNLFQAENNVVAQTASNAAVIGSQSGSYNTTGGAITNYGGNFSNTSTRSSGANALNNVGVYCTASGGQNNYAGIFDSGIVLLGTDVSTDQTTKFQVRGSASFQRRVVNNTSSPVSLSSSLDNFKVFTNTGASGLITYNLPVASSGLTYTFINMEAAGTNITPAGGDTIRLSTAVTAPGAAIQSTGVGAVITLVAINSDEWVQVYFVGTWAAV